MRPHSLLTLFLFPLGSSIFSLQSDVLHRYAPHVTAAQAAQSFEVVQHSIGQAWRLRSLDDRSMNLRLTTVKLSLPALAPSGKAEKTETPPWYSIICWWSRPMLLENRIMGRVLQIVPPHVAMPDLQKITLHCTPDRQAWFPVSMTAQDSRVAAMLTSLLFHSQFFEMVTEANKKSVFDEQPQIEDSSAVDVESAAGRIERPAASQSRLGARRMGAAEQ